MKKEITLTRMFNVPRERVWDAWTKPDELAKWWGPKGVTNPESRIDLREGGEIYIVMLAGKELGPLAGQRWPMRGTFTEIKAPEKLVFENNAVDEQGNVLLRGKTTVQLEENGGGTKMTLTTGAEGDAPGTEQMLAGMEQGWTESLEKLSALLA